MIFPWQTTQWQQLLKSQQTKHLPHALLFAGCAGVGKIQFTRSFLHRLLCQEVNLYHIDCHAAQKTVMCHACQLIRKLSHPNVLWIEPEKKGQVIKINQIREINEFIHQSTLQQGYCIVVIHPADNMNVNSANALLKTLEEPPLGSMLILISDQPSRLPATILSRCQRILFKIPERKETLSWLSSQLTDSSYSPELLLSIANDAPLTALYLAETNIMTVRQILFDALYLLRLKKEDPLCLTLSLQKMDILQFIDMTSSWLLDILRLQLDIDCILNQDYQEQLAKLNQTMNNQDIIKLMTYLQIMRIQINQGMNLNKQLMMEDILIRYLNIR